MPPELKQHQDKIVNMNSSDRRSNPFPGLRPFNLDEDYLFFGREKQVAELLRLLRQHRFIAVVGTSGSGKSSLVRAGLLPALLGGTVADVSSDWEVVITRPGGDPITNLAKSLLDADLYDGDDEESLLRLKATLNRSRLGLVEASRQSDIAADCNLLVVIDQFEELFRFGQTSPGHQEAAAAFVKLLLSASQQSDQSIFVTITMRSDYLGDCSQIPGLAEAVNRGEYLIPRLSRHELETAINGPVQVGGGEIAFRLVQHLLNSVGDDPDQLPVLQHVLMRTWDRWSDDHNTDGPIDIRHYESVGGMAEALSRHADEVYDTLPSDHERAAAESIFKSLTEKGSDNRGIRRPSRLADLAEITGYPLATVANVIEAYRQPGVTFLMPGATQTINETTVIDLSHESLMRVWQRLRTWVEEEAQSARIYQRLADTAQLWQSGRAGLYHDPDLQIAQSWRVDQRPNEAWAAQYGGCFADAMAFLDESHQAAEAAELAREEARQKELAQAKALAESRARAATNLRRFAVVATTLMVLAVGLSIWAIKLQRQAEKNRSRAVASAEQATRAEQLAVAEAENARQARQQTETLLRDSRHEQGVVWLERARTHLQTEKDHISAKLMASRAIGFEGVGRSTQQESFRETYPVLLKRDSAEWREVLSFLSSQPDYSVIWARPTTSHDQSGFNLAYSPDGLRIATRHRNGAVYVWDSRSGERLAEFPIGGDDVQLLWRLHFSPDGKRIYAPADDRVVILDIESQTEVARLSLTQPLQAETLAANGETLPTVSDFVRGIAVSPNGRWIAAGGSGGGFHIWDASTLDDVRVLQVASAIQSMEFHPDSKRLYIGDNSGQIHIYDLDANRVVSSHSVHRSTIYGLRFSPDGGLIGSASADDDLALSDANNLTEIARVTFASNVNAVAFDSSGDLVACCDNDDLIHIIDVKTQAEIQTLKGHTGNVLSIDFGLDDELGSCSNDGTFRFWDVKTGEEKRAQEHVLRLDFVALNSTGTMLASGGQDGVLRLWDLRNGALAAQYDHGGAIHDAVFSPDESIIITTDASNALVLRDVETGEIVDRIQTIGAERVAISLDGRWMAAGLASGDIRIWAHSSGKCEFRHDLQGHRGQVRSLCFSADGQFLVSIASDDTVRVWNLDRSAELYHWEVDSVVIYSRAIFDPSVNRVAAVAGNTVHLWDLESGRSLNRRLPQTFVQAIAFSKNGRWLATGGLNGEVRIWNAATYELVATLRHQTSVVTRLEFSPDSQMLVSACQDGSIRLWELSHGATPTWDKGPSAFHPHGRLVAIGGLGPFRIVDAFSNAPYAELEGASSRITLSPSFSPNGAFLAANRAGNPPAIVVWRTTGERVSRYPVPGLSPREKAVFTHDSQRLVIPYREDRLVGFADVRTGEEVRIPCGVNPVAVAAHPHKSLVAAVGRRRIRRFQNNESDWVRLKPDLPLDGTSPARAAFSPDGKRFAVARETTDEIIVWDAETWEVVDRYQERNCRAICFGPTDLLATLGKRTAVRDLQSKQTVFTDDLGAGLFGEVSISRDNRLLASSVSIVNGRPEFVTKLSELETSNQTQRDYAVLLDQYRFQGRTAVATGVGNLFHPDKLPFESLSTDNLFAILSGKPSDEQDAILFEHLLNANNLDAAAVVLSRLKGPPAVSARKSFAQSVLAVVRMRRSNLALAKRYLDLAEGFAADNDRVSLQVARAQLIHSGESPDQAFGYLDAAIDEALQADNTPGAQRLARTRLELRLEDGDPQQLKTDLEYVLDFPSTEDSVNPAKVTLELLDATYDESSRDKTLLLARAMLRGFLEARSGNAIDLARNLDLVTLGNLVQADSEVLIGENADWKFFENGVVPTNWAQPGFDDAAWSNGHAPLGFPQDQRIRTTLTRGQTTYYFRHDFEFRAPETSSAAVTLRMLRDDGVIIYLNGEELFRDNIEGSNTFAVGSISGPAEFEWVTAHLESVTLRDGRNTIAAEVHQYSRQSSDIFWEMSLVTAAPRYALIASVTQEAFDAAIQAIDELAPRQLAETWRREMRAAFASSITAGHQHVMSPGLWETRRKIQTVLGNEVAAIESGFHQFVHGRAAMDQNSRTKQVDELLASISALPASGKTAELFTRLIGIVSPADPSDKSIADLLASLQMERLQSVLSSDADLDHKQDALVTAMASQSLGDAQRHAAMTAYLDAFQASVLAEDETQSAALDLLRLLEHAVRDDAITATSVFDVDFEPLPSTSGPAKKLVDAETIWYYWDQQADPPEDWKSTAFDATAWPSAAGAFGFGDDARDYTKLADGRMSYFFRAEFDADLKDIGPNAGLLVNMAVDDGAVVYLNGAEILRKHMPPSPITAMTRSTYRGSGSVENTLAATTFVDLAGLKQGRNVFAVQVHQTNSRSTDVYFQLLADAGPTWRSRLATMSADELSQRLAEAASILPGELARDWLDAMQFAATSDVDTQSARMADADAQMARARMQFILGHYQDAETAMNRALELLYQSESPADTANRYRIVVAMQKLLQNTQQLDRWDDWLRRHVQQELAIAKAYRLNCGGDVYIGSAGDVWGPDHLYLAGIGIRDTASEYQGVDEELYLTYHTIYSGSDPIDHAMYAIPFPNGKYRVRLHFMTNSEVGYRKQDLKIEGQTVEHGFDIAAAVGRYSPAIPEFDVEIRDGQFDLALESNVSSTIMGIEILACE